MKEGPLGFPVDSGISPRTLGPGLSNELLLLHIRCYLMNLCTHIYQLP